MALFSVFEKGDPPPQKKKLMYLSMQFTFFQPKHFSLVIREGGSDFNEDIDIDEEKGEALLRVPAHNNIDGASFLNDFNLVRTRSKFIIKSYLSNIPDLISGFDHHTTSC